MMTMTFTTRTGVKPLAAATLAVLALGLTACNKTPDNNAAGNASQPAATTSEATLDKIKNQARLC